MSDVYQTSITSELFAKLAASEYAVVRTYTHKDGMKTAEVIGIGSLEDMTELAGRNCLLIVPNYLENIGDCVVPVAELLPPDKANESGQRPLPRR